MNRKSYVPSTGEVEESSEDRLPRPPGGDRWVVGGEQPAGDYRHRAALGLGRYLRAARLNRGWTYDDLSSRCGLDRVTLIALENGLYRPAQIDRRWLAPLARSLGEDVDDLRLLLGIPLGESAREPAEPTTTYHFLSADISASGQAVAVQLTYLGAGWRNSRDRFRPARPSRDPERLYFDK